MVIVDTSVWVDALRDSSSSEKAEVDRLIIEDDLAMIGPVLTELLRGARSEREFLELADALRAPTFIESKRADWRLAGELTLNLKQRGVTVGYVDALIAAIAINGDHAVYAKDTDFDRIPGVRLHVPAL